MQAFDLSASDPSLHPLPCYTDWQGYDTPTVLRRQGRDFRQRFGLSELSTSADTQSDQEHQPLSKADLKSLVASYGGLCFCSVDKTLLLFPDYHWARRCQRQLTERGLTSIRLGCHIQLSGVD